MRSILLTTISWIIAVMNISAQGIQFTQQQTWNQILAKAKAENKFIFMDAFTTWCGPCKAMDAEVFSKKEVGDEMNKQFISVKMQMDQAKNDSEFVKSAYTDAQTLMKQYQITAFPTLLFFSPEGKLIHSILGFKAVPEFIAEVKSITKPGKQYDELLEEYAKGAMDTAAMKALVLQANQLGDKANAEKIAADYISRLSNSDWYKKENLIFTGQFLRNSTDPNYKRFIKEKVKIDSAIGSKGFTEAMIRWLIYREMETYDLSAEVDWDKIDKEMTAAYGSLAKEYIFQSKLKYYSLRKDWAVYGKIYKNYFDEMLPKMTGRPPFLINSFSWKIVEHISDPGVLETAIKAMKYDLDKLSGDKDPSNIDTYANLLYKAGKKEEAIEWEEKAVKLSNNDKSLMETLEKMRQSQLIFK